MASMVSQDTVEFWVRNGRLCMDEALAMDQTRFVWSTSFMKKNHQTMNIHKYMDVKCRGRKWEYIVVGEQEASWHTPQHDREHPKAVWPVWHFGRNTLDELEQWMANPVGQNKTLCSDESVSSHCRPVYGQEERIIVFPGPLNGQGGKVARTISDMQEEYPDVMLHLHGTGSFYVGFGLNFGAFDFEPRAMAWRGNIHMPCGYQAKGQYEYPKWEEWIRLCGFTPHELDTVARNRVKFNIRSAQWASQNFKKNVRWKTKGFDKSPISRSMLFKRAKVNEADKLSCYKCSLQLACKFYREGSVCSVPGSEGNDLAKMFKSRDADTIVEALSDLLAKNADRLELAMDAEEEKGQIDPGVTRLIESTWDRAERLAKILKPTLGTVEKPASSLNFLNVNVAKSPQELAAAIFAELQERGVSRDDITPELVENLMAMTAEDKQKAISVLAVGSGSS